MLVNTVEFNTSKYSECDYNKTLLAKKLQYIIALPSHRHLIKIVEDKVQMINCSLNFDDVRRAEDIWGGKPRMPKSKYPKTKNATH